MARQIMGNNKREALPGPTTSGDPTGDSWWKMNDICRLRRFLCLGVEVGCYCIHEQRKLCLDMARCTLRLITDGNGELVVQEIVRFGMEGQAAKLNPLCFALALCARSDSNSTKTAAYEAFNKVCNTPAHLFSFVGYCEGLSIGTGWGRAHRRAICHWYNSKSPEDLAMAVTTCRSQAGWTHLDILRLAHLKPATMGIACVCKCVVKGFEACRNGFFVAEVDLKGKEVISRTLRFLEAVDAARTATDAPLVVDLIHKHGLTREHCPAPLLRSPEIWVALLQCMPMIVMIHNLGKMSSIGLFKQHSSEVELVCKRLGDKGHVQEAGLHPFCLLLALKSYESGGSTMGKVSWEVNPNIVRSLDCAFHLSFEFIESTGKRFLLALDVSGSMEYSHVVGSSILTTQMASAAMAMAAVRTEICHLVGFSPELMPLPIHADMKLDDVCKTLSQVPMGTTDCALPMLYALQHDLQIDVFIVYTDKVTHAGDVDPSLALMHYRKGKGIDARLVVCALGAHEFSIADPDDRGMLDVAGFDSSVPDVIRSFAMGDI